MVEGKLGSSGFSRGLGLNFFRNVYNASLAFGQEFARIDSTKWVLLGKIPNTKT